MLPPNDLAARLAPWGEARVLRALPGGHRNLAFLVHINGTACVAKSTRHSEASLQWVARLQRIAQHLGLLLPPYLPNHYGAYASTGWTVEPFLQGQPGTHSDLQRLKTPIQRLHRATWHLPKRPHMATSQNLIPLGLPQSLRAQLTKTLNTTLGTNAHCAIHADLSPSNLLHTPQGHIALLDWDEARKDDPHFDHAALSATQTPARRAMEIATGWRAEPAYARHLLYKA